MKQSEIMLGGEGDAWFERNRDRLGQVDHVSDVIEECGIAPKRAIEIGCSNGWRLAKLRNRYGCHVTGVEPSKQACSEAAALRVRVFQTTASDMGDLYFNPSDLVIYGFCLYLTDPEDWLRIAAEGDRILKPGGHLVIHDFYEAGLGVEFRIYEHDKRLQSFHFDFARLWLAHPFYWLVRRKVFGEESVVILKKGLK